MSPIRLGNAAPTAHMRPPEYAPGEKPKDGFYKVFLSCSNCGYQYLAAIPKGASVASFCNNKECDVCGVKNTMSKAKE